MIRIGITAEAFKAIKATLPLGSVGFDHERTTNGGLVWLDARTMNNLEALRQPGEAWEPLGAQKQRNGQLEQSWTPAFA